MKKLLFINLFFLILNLHCSFAQEQKYGLCTQEFITLYSSPNQASEQVTQLLFGDVYKVLKISGNWFYIQNLYDNYEGWIAEEQYYPISEWFYNQYKTQNFPICADLKGYVIWKNKKVPISFGSTLPFYENGLITIASEEAKFEGNAFVPPQSLDKSLLIKNAKSYLSIPYLWGGKSTEGLDCSGFTQIIYKSAGVDLPRDSYQQAELGTLVSFEDIEAGDLAFFQREGKIVHVGILLGNEKIIHACGGKTVRVDIFDETGIYNEEDEKYSHYLKFIKRME